MCPIIQATSGGWTSMQCISRNSLSNIKVESGTIPGHRPRQHRRPRPVLEKKKRVRKREKKNLKLTTR